ncbi:P1 family peptidase [Albimonas sp. CAU 1670]|uniref:P1 family peptidase n=1 Tax=Albimonas sp. CAU 1670 TaxID=3032599 RepID=UPI0023DBA9E1|nr:P1 family peptidase [Albimonas sp. CAU 1670]MDF2235281.1 P1 family peptidase [Albimonas sp. CAU 1670]
MPRARDLGLDVPGTPGRFNAITDVPGVRVGYETIIDPARNLRTGVTAILPRQDEGDPQPVWAGRFDLNGNGEMTGSHWIDDAGWFFGPVMITNTHSVGMVHHAATRWMIDAYSDYFATEHAWAMPVVAETYDGVLSDINAQAVTPEHARAALERAAGGPVAEGSVGGGAGMIAYEFKGGSGTASRLVEAGGETYTVGAFVQANHGLRPWLTVLGVPVGREMTEGRLKDRESGSIIVVLATDAPLSGLGLRQMAKRAALGVGRGGSPGGDSSGDVFLAFTVADPGPMPLHAGPVRTRRELNGGLMDPLYLAAVEAVEEAVLNALTAGEDAPTVKPAGKTCRAIDLDRLVEIMGRAGRLRG